MEFYLVGGAIRDKLLDIPVKDKDWVVVGANREQMLALGYEQVGKGFPVFLHPQTKQEYALARTETKIAPGYTGFEFDTAESVSLEQDLQRRDLTINAMAQSEDGEIIDPYQGRRDLKQRILRHVSPAFNEDPLRVLRVAKFAARFSHLGFEVAAETMALMQSMAASGELDALVKERVWQEIEAALSTPDPARFIQVMRDCGALKVILPEVDQLFGVPQPARYHPEIDTGIHILMCLQQVSKLSLDPVVRWATLVHDVGKAITDKDKLPSHFGHETLGLKLQAEISLRLKVPNEFSQLAALVCEHHTKLHRVTELRPTTLLKLLQSLDAIRRPERLDKFLLSCEADARGRTGFEERDYPQRQYLLDILDAVRALDIAGLLKGRDGEDKQADPKQLIQQHRLLAITSKVAALTAEQ